MKNEREVAEHDRRHAGQQLEDRLDGLAHAGPRVLGEVDRRRQAQRDGHDHGNGADEQRAQRQRQHTERGRLEQRRPVGAEQVPPIPTSPKNLTVSWISESTIPVVVSTETKAASIRRP